MHTSMYQEIARKWVRNHRKLLPILGWVVGLLVAFYLLFRMLGWLFGTHKVLAEVKERDWRRTIYVSQAVWTDERSQSGPPEGARNVSTAWEVVGSREVPDGESCSYSFTMKRTSCTPKYRSESIYGTVYHYQVREWQRTRQVAASGVNNTPSWPTYTLQTATDQPERLDGNDQIYRIKFQAGNGGKVYTQSLPQSQWRTMQVGTGYTLQVDNAGNIRHFTMN